MCLQKKYTQKHIDWEWLLGFIDAEGNFNITKEKRTTKKSGTYLKLSYNFHISLSYKDLDLLQEIKNFLQMGRIYLHKERKEAHFVIYKVCEVQKFVSLLREHNLYTRHQFDKF